MDQHGKVLLVFSVFFVHWMALQWFDARLSAPASATPTSTALFSVQADVAAKPQPISKTSKVAAKREPIAPAAPSLVSDAAGFNNRVYFSAEELDASARPVMDWVIARESIPEVGGASLLFKVWISADGTIDHFEVANPAEAPAWVGSVLSPLGQTLMEPARRNGIPVASTMMVEIIIDSTNLLP